MCASFSTRAQLRGNVGHGYENTEPGCILTVFSVPSVICSQEDPMPSPARLRNRFHAAGTSGHLLIDLGPS